MRLAEKIGVSIAMSLGVLYVRSGSLTRKSTNMWTEREPRQSYARSTFDNWRSKISHVMQHEVPAEYILTRARRRY